MPKKQYILAIFFCAFMLFSFSTEGKVTHATSDGDWSSSGTWDNGVPACGDSIIIDKDIVVDVDVHVTLDEAASCSTAIYLEISGVLFFNAGKKMYLSCNSHIVITSDGELKKGSNGGSSSLIDICATEVWKAGDGDQPGPAPIGPGLPITLIEFSAKPESDLIQLSWSTASEINNEYFTVERSVDLKSFSEVLRYPGAGNSREILIYTAYDRSPLQGISYYRLKQTDFDGSTTYSRPVSATFNRINSEKFRVFPSLVLNGLLNIEIYGEDQGHAIIELFTSEGRVLYSKSIYLSENEVIYTIDVSNIPYNGLVVLRLTSFNTSYESKLILTSE